MDSRQLTAAIDHTNLKPDATSSDIAALCREAADFGFAAVCINPCYVKLAAEQLSGSTVNVATVIGFPLGATTSAVKVFEAGEAVRNGAREIDYVINIAAVKEKRTRYITEEIQKVRAAIEGVMLKVILETGLLTTDEKRLAAHAAAGAGADMLKTSTGFFGGAALEDVHLLKEAAPHLGVKASGGIRTAEFALQLLAAGAVRLGTSSAVRIISELELTMKEE